MLDCRAERRKNMVLTPETYQQVFGILRDLPKGVEHLIIQLGIPIAYPRMNFAELVFSHSELSVLTRLQESNSFRFILSKDGKGWLSASWVF